MDFGKVLWCFPDFGIGSLPQLLTIIHGYTKPFRPRMKHTAWLLVVYLLHRIDILIFELEFRFLRRKI